MAPVDYQTASVKFGQGLDTKTDSKLVVQGKLLTLSNGIFTNAGRLSKRNGYDAMSMSIIGGGTISTPYMMTSYKNSLICADGTYLYDFSTTANAWRNVGRYASIQTTQIPINGGTQTQSNTNACISGNYAVVASEVWGSFTTGAQSIATTLTAIDLTTNTQVGTAALGTNQGFTRLFTFGDGVMGVFYLDIATLTLYFRTVTVSSSGVVLGSAVSISANIKDYTGAGAPLIWYSYDLVASGNNCSLAISLSTAGTPISLITVNSAGASQGTGSIANAGNALPLSIIKDASNNLWIYWVADTGTISGAVNGFYAIVSSTFSSVLAKTQIGVNAFNGVRQIVGYNFDATNQRIHYFFGTGDRSYNFNTAGTSAVFPATNTDTPIYTGAPFAKAFTYNSTTYLPVANVSTDQFTGFLADVTNTTNNTDSLSRVHKVPIIVGKFLVGAAESISSYWLRYPGFAPVASAYGSNQIILPSGKVVQNNLNANANVPLFVTASVLVVFTFNASEAFQALEANGQLILNGSVPCLYDGSIVTELGFHNYPTTSQTTALAAGSLPDGTYIYYAVARWIDNNGDIHQSTPSDALTVSVSGGGGNAKVTISAVLGSLSQKPSVYIDIYRTLSAGTIPYLLTSILTSLPSSQSVSYVDDGTIAVSQSIPMYTNGGAVLNNASPPCSMLMWLNNNRIWMVDSENPNTDLWPSKSFANLTGVSMCAELVSTIDSRLGKIVLGRGMDEKTIIIKEQGLMYFIGDAANDAGQGSSLTLAQIIPSDVGGSGSKGAIIIPEGLIFRASNNKGIYILTRGIQVAYFGNEVESYNSQDIQDAQMIPNRSQVRFLTSSGSSLVYDYIFKQWSTFSNHTGYSGAVWNGTYVYARTDGTIFKESSTSFLDNATAFTLAATTAWLKASQIQNFMRVRLAELLGDFTGAGGHGLQIAAAYDFSSTSTNCTPITFSGSNGPFQYRAFLPQQKCDAFQLIFTEITTGASSEFIDFSDLALELGLKKGANKLPASQSVG